MTITLNKQEQELIRQRVTSGEFPTDEAVVREAIALMLGTHRAMTPELMNELIDAGVRDLDEGRVLTAEQVDEQWAARRAEYKARTAGR